MPSRHSIERMKGPDGQHWVVVAVGHGEAEAAILAGRLDSVEIPTWVYRESAGTAIAVSFGELGNVYILVPEEYYEQASDMLELDDSTQSAALEDLAMMADDADDADEIEDDEEDESSSAD